MGCDSITDGYDNDPNSPREVNPDLTLNGGQVGLITLLEANFARVASMFSQQMTGSTRQYNRIENGFDVSSGDFDNQWSTGYADVINEMGVVKEQGRQTGASVLVNVAKIQESHAFGTFAALFGDVPFSETNNGAEIANPAFDNQVDIYDSIQDSLGAAAQALEDYQNNSTVPLDIAFGDTELDLFYGGDVSSWIKVAYSLKARYHLHQGEYQAALDAANKGILDSSNDWIAPHGTSFGSNSNLWFNFFVLRGGYLTAEEAWAPQLLDNPLFSGSSNTNYRGNAKTDEGARYTSYYIQAPAGSGNYQLTDFFAAFGFGQSFPLFRAAETHLIRAEAIMKLKDSDGSLSRGDAVDALNSARSANEDWYPNPSYLGDQACFFVEPSDPSKCYLDYDVGDFESGGMSRDTPSDVSETTDNAILTEILEEKYLSTITKIEGWNEVRRTENFLNIPTKQGASEFPERWPYAQIELSANDNAPQPPPTSEETPVNANLDYQPIDN